MADDDVSIKLLIEAEDRSDAALDKARRNTQQILDLQKQLQRQLEESDKATVAGDKAKAGSANEYFNLRKRLFTELPEQLARAYSTEEQALRKASQAHEAHAAAVEKASAKKTSAIETAGAALQHYARHFLSIAAAEEILRRSIDEYAKVERSMARIQLEAGKTTRETEHLHHSFDGLARLTGQSFEKVAQSFQTFRGEIGGNLEEVEHLFEDIQRAAFAAGVSFDTMSRTAVTAVKTMNVPMGEVKEMLDVIVKEVPASAMTAWDNVAPKILTIMRNLGATGKESVQSAASAFANLSQAMGSSSQAASFYQQMMQKATDTNTLFGRVMIPQLIEFNKEAGGGTKALEAMYQQMVQMGMFDASPETALFMQQRFGFSPEMIEGARKAHETYELIRKEIDKTGEAWDVVEKRILRLQRGPQSAIDDLKGAVGELYVEIAKFFGAEQIPDTLAKMVTGIKNDLAFVNTLFEKWREMIGARDPTTGKETPIELIPSEKTIVDRLNRRYGTETPEQRSERERIDREDREKRKAIEGTTNKPSQPTGRKGFAIGGSFDVKSTGSGGIDEEDVSFKATPGERVDVTTPQQESLKQQQDKADQAMRDHFARFHQTAFTKQTDAKWMEYQPPEGKEGGGAGGGGGGPLSGGGWPGYGGATRGPSSGTTSTTATSPPGTKENPLKIPTNTDPNSPQGPAQDLETAYDRGYLIRPQDPATAGTIDRSSLAKGLTPDMIAQLAYLTRKEVGGSDPEKRKMFLATLMNRTLIESGDLNKQLNSPPYSNYYPGTQRGRADAKEVEDFKKSVLDPVMKGEGGDYTHNASNEVNNPVADNATRLYNDGKWVGAKDPEYFYRKTGNAAKLEQFRAKGDQDKKDVATKGGSVGTAEGVLEAVRQGQVLNPDGTVSDKPASTATGGDIELPTSREAVQMPAVEKDPNYPNVTEMQPKVAKDRQRGLDPRLKGALDVAAGENGLKVVVTSGGQHKHGEGGTRTGSLRHDHGGAADFDLLDAKTGKVLPRNDPRRLAFLQRAASLGAGGAGTGYMSDSLKIHMGITGSASKVGEGLGAYAGNDAERAAINKGVEEWKKDPTKLARIMKERRELAQKKLQDQQANNKPATAPTSTKATTDQKADGQKASGKSAAAVAAHNTQVAAADTGAKAAGKSSTAVAAHNAANTPAANPDKSGGIGSRQQGGPVRTGQPYMVGEGGPEVFEPSTPGDIHPHGQEPRGAPEGYRRFLGGGDHSEALKQYRELRDEMTAPIRPQLEMPRAAPIRQRMSRHVEQQRERDVTRMTRHAAHSDIGFT